MRAESTGAVYTLTWQSRFGSSSILLRQNLIPVYGTRRRSSRCCDIVDRTYALVFSFPGDAASILYSLICHFVLRTIVHEA